MYSEIIKELKKQLTSEEFEDIKNKKIQLGIFSEPYLSYMLEGSKTIESRFSRNKIAPYEQISKDDLVIVKKSCGNVVAYFTIKEVLFFDLAQIEIGKIKAKYNKELCVSDEFWNLKKNSNYAALIVIDKIVKLKPFHINKKGMQTWVNLNK